MRVQTQAQEGYLQETKRSDNLCFSLTSTSPHLNDRRLSLGLLRSLPDGPLPPCSSASVSFPQRRVIIPKCKLIVHTHTHIHVTHRHSRTPVPITLKNKTQIPRWPCPPLHSPLCLIPGPQKLSPAGFFPTKRHHVLRVVRRLRGPDFYSRAPSSYHIKTQ